MGKMDAWGLSNHAMMEDNWDYVRITTWNFLPFVLKRVGAAPGWVVRTVSAVWTTAVIALLSVLSRLALSRAISTDGR